MQPILFDFDGVIADSEHLIAQVMAQTLSEFGLQTDIDDYLELYLGLSYKDTRQKLTEAFGGALPQNYEETSRERIQDAVEKALQPVPGVLAFLERTLQHLEAYAIASSSSADWILQGLNRFGFAETFNNRVYSAVGLPRAKPFPDVYLHAAREQGISIEKSWVIEDSVNGVKAGKAAGATVIGLLAGSHIRDKDRQRLSVAGADFIANSYDEVLQLVRNDVT